MASVRFDDLDDPRFIALGMLIGMDEFAAIGRMGKIYKYCTDRQTYSVPKLMIHAITRIENFADHMIASGLGEEFGDEIRVKGTKGRIEWLRKLRQNGKRGGRPKKPEVNQSETNIEPSANPLTITPSKAITLTRSSRRRKNAAPADGPTPGSRVWDAYSAAFKTRWGDDPPRNAEANSLCKRLVDKLGVDDAPSVAEFYVAHRDALYVKAMHPLTLLIRDASKIRTEWATGRVSTAPAAIHGDLRQHNVQVVKEFLAEGPK